MGLKEKLESLSNSQVYILWNLWIYQSSPSPNEKQMIEDILNAAYEFGDSELLVDIADIEKPNIDSENKKLLDFLQTAYDEYKKIIDPLMQETYLAADPVTIDDDCDAYDMAKNEFLENLWDGISQHFDDKSF